ncbi:hypothetical protein CIL05_18270 [Virgibacillus profundi]|uniref:histidine kinase n=1 Tax=Virgibacillus profundi TaxID=2024555 RepID=A0A2A2I8U4_9BACI|nr:ATP-binding protein [Virgibacillus profundi]PAV28057.1 hypothetical protein CIL05_18270 [Virgibacillus profundi]PXY52361.1 hypothetical protein CIT14_17715 [Virgibacillus profundi]
MVKWNHIVFLLFFIMIIITVQAGLVHAKDTVSVDEGKAVLPELSEDSIIKLNGEWEFYWHERHDSVDLRQGGGQLKPSIVDVPADWSNYKALGEALPSSGHATYRLQIYLPKNELGTYKAIYISGAASAYSLLINGEEKFQRGIPGTNRKEEIPANSSEVIPFYAETNPVELIVQVSNYSQRRAGIYEPVLIGEPETLFKHREKTILYRSIIVVSLVIIGLYHFIIFLFRKKDYSFLFFAIVCTVVAIRATIIEQALAGYLLPFLNFEVATSLEYLGASLGALFLTLFTCTQFPEDMHRKIRNGITIVLGVYSLFVILTPALVFTQTMILLQVLVLVAVLYGLIIYIKAVPKRRPGSYLNAAATFILILLVINDVLYYNDLIRTTELTSVGLFFFLFTQAVILSKSYSTSFARAERLSDDLSLLNASLEKQVKNRTIELEMANDELYVTNQKLYEAQQSKNKWIRNISHEIAAPLTAIQSYTKGMVDGVIEPEQKYTRLIHDQSKYLSSMLHDLHDISEMENNQITFSMKKMNIGPFIQGIYEKYKWDLEKQGIEFVHKDLLPLDLEDLFVRIDPIRIEQVIVNLLKNAQRFVGEDGKITLELALGTGDVVIVKIMDNGIGIKEDEQNQLFQRFYKSKQRKAHNGAGLGLPIAKEIIDYHNGEISVESIPSEGSCFYFMLPIEAE